MKIRGSLGVFRETTLICEMENYNLFTEIIDNQVGYFSPRNPKIENIRALLFEFKTKVFVVSYQANCYSNNGVNLLISKAKIVEIYTWLFYF